MRKSCNFNTHYCETTLLAIGRWYSKAGYSHTYYTVKYGDLTGRRFGHLTALKRIRVDDDHPKSMWLCQCDCGKQTTPLADSLVKGRRTSCGHGNTSAERMSALEKGHYDKLFVDGIAVGLIDSTRKKVAKNSKTGITGVSVVQRKNGEKYLAQIYVNHVRTRLGYFDTKEEAREARLEAERKRLPQKDDANS